jgi:hypothetical protein
MLYGIYGIECESGKANNTSRRFVKCNFFLTLAAVEEELDQGDV